MQLPIAEVFELAHAAILVVDAGSQTEVNPPFKAFISLDGRAIGKVHVLSESLPTPNLRPGHRAFEIEGDLPVSRNELMEGRAFLCIEPK